MAVHTGEAQLRDEGNYVGLALARCARIRSCGHGGQVLVSEAAAALVGDAPPPDATLRDLGTHRLKDLGRPERVWQLVHPDVEPDFPPLRSLDAVRRHGHRAHRTRPHRRRDRPRRRSPRLPSQPEHCRLA
jgi:class 3 adenylate cyclase